VIGHFLPHVIAGALGQALPDRVMAEGSANIWGIQVSGKDLTDQPFSYVFFSSGGTGARATKDGLSATAFPSGVLGTPAEVIENLSPLVIERGVRGAQARAVPGGLGQTIAFRVQSREPVVCSILGIAAPAPRPGLPGRPGAGEVLIDGWPVEPEGRAARAAGRPRRECDCPAEGLRGRRGARRRPRRGRSRARATSWSVLDLPRQSPRPSQQRVCGATADRGAMYPVRR
jgi:N-methylhydantoinase B